MSSVKCVNVVISNKIKNLLTQGENKKESWWINQCKKSFSLVEKLREKTKKYYPWKNFLTQWKIEKKKSKNEGDKTNIL